MRLTVLGSGGFRVVPRPGCDCRVCSEARVKGFRRLGPSMFIHDENVLFDTPENIIVELESAGIDRVEHILYTHWHPDHTFGARLVEQMNTAWSDDLSWRQVSKSRTEIHMPKPIHGEVMERLGPFFEFWGHIGVAEVNILDDAVAIGSLKIEPVVMKSLHRTLTHVALYLISSGDAKVLYAPCDITPFPDDDRLQDCDLMILQTGWWGKEMAARAAKGPHYEISMEEVCGVIDKYRPGRVVLTHIGDELGMTLADLEEMEARLGEFDVRFAFDGMKIEI